MFKSRYITSSLIIISSALGCSPTINVPSIVDNTAGSGGEAGGGADSSGGSKAKGGSTSKAGSSAKGGSGGRTSTSSSTGGNGNNTGGTTNSGGSAPTDTSSSTLPNSGGTSSTGGTTAGGTSTGASSSGGTTTAVPAPVITNFAVDYNKVCPGGTPRLTAVYANGIATIDNGVTSVSSGNAITAPAISSDTTYKLTVTNSAGISTSQTMSVKVLASGQFTPTGSLNTSRLKQATALLEDGRVVTIGGDPTGSVELYDLNAGTFSQVSNGPGTLITWPQAISLPNSKVLVTDHTAAWVFDTKTANFTAASPFSTRSVHTSTWLPTLNKALITGGCDNNDTLLATTLLFNSASTASNAFSAGANLTTSRARHVAALLPSGKVLIASGTNDCDDNSGTGTVTAELYDPTSGAVGATTATGPMNTGRLYASAITLANGKVLVVGGVKDYNFNELVTTELFDPSLGTNGQFSNGSNMNFARRLPSLVRLKNSNVLVVGGTSSLYAEVYSQASGQFTVVGQQLQSAGQVPTLLANGVVLLAGGNSKLASLYCP